ncbi:hypothetical protein [Streptomyces collinus]|uniref:hypothetical protein n=1 Tax=Streptomyces collinus TaxID=42684 RepID=UPI00331D4C84
MDHFTGLWDLPSARPLEVGRGVAVGVAAGAETEVEEVADAALVGAVVGADVAAEVTEAVAGWVGLEFLGAAVELELFRAAADFALPAEWPVPTEASGAAVWGVERCGESGRGTNGALRLGPPSTALISRAT